MAGVDSYYWVTPALTLACAGLFGLLVGSFLNVVIHRLPLMMQAQWEAEAAEFEAARRDASEPDGEDAAAIAHAPAGASTDARDTGRDAKSVNLLTPRSRCPSCGHPITALENIPVLSWLWLRGRCSACRSPIPIRYPLIEMLAGVLAVASIGHFGLTLQGGAAVVLCLSLITLAFIDLDTQLLPDDITLPLLWAGLLLNLVGGFVPLRDAVLGAVAGYLLLWSIYWLFRLITGKEGMGYGDFKLLAALGAWFGWQSIPAVILLASVVGAVVGVGLMVLAKHGRDVPIPFGPYLAGAGALTLFFGPSLLSLYGLA